MAPRLLFVGASAIMCLSFSGCFGGMGSSHGSGHGTNTGGSPSGSGGSSGGGGWTGGSGGGGKAPAPQPTTEPSCYTDADCWEMISTHSDCQVPVCDSVTGTCTVGIVQDFTPCEDGDVCTTADVCLDGACVATEGAFLPCDDGDPCTTDYCDPTDGCFVVPEETCMIPTGECCDPHGGLGCFDPVVESCVCGADPYCCEQSWDAQCASEVESYGCGSCGQVPPPIGVTASCEGSCGGQSPSGCYCDEGCETYGDCCDDICVFCPGVSACAGGDCCSASDYAGCPDAGCEACTCSIDSMCCDVAWDETCVMIAEGECAPECGCGPSGACTVAHAEPGCGSPSCEACICSEDEYCCNAAWDDVCVEEVTTLGCWECGG